MWNARNCLIAAALALAPVAASAADIFISVQGRGQADRTALTNTRLRYDSEGQNPTIFAGDYLYNTSELELVSITNHSFSCSLQATGRIQVNVAGSSDGDICTLGFRAKRVSYPRASGFSWSQETCFFQFPNSGSCSGFGGTGFNIIGPTINPSSGSSITLTSSLGLAAPSTIVRISNTGVSGSVLSVLPATSGSPLSVTSAGSTQEIAAGAFRDYTISCATTSVGTFTRTVTFAHNATPNQASPLSYTVTCRILNPPTLVYGTSPGTAISIPGTNALGTTRQIDIKTSGGDSGAARSLSCSSHLGYSIGVETSPFVTGGSGRIRLGCDSNPVPQPVTLTCVESANSTARTWPISCLSDEAFTATPSFATPVRLEGQVGGPAPTATFVVTNTGTEGTFLQVGPPSGLSGALSISPSATVSIAQGTAGVTYTVSCNTVAAFDATQTLSLSHNAPGSPSQLEVTCNIHTPPTLAYSPSFGNSVQVSASVGGTTPTVNIGVTASGADPDGKRGLSCSVNQPNYTVTVDTSPFQTGSTGNVRLACDSLDLDPGTLTCTESPGGTARQWPLTCANTAVYTSTPRPSSAVGVYSAIGETGFVEADVSIENKGTAGLSIPPQSCVQSPSSFFGVNITPNPISGNSSGTMTVTCPAPEFGSAEFRTLSCGTNDPTRPSVVYKLICVAPPITDSGEGSSPTNRLTSPSPDGGALLGSATVIATAPNGDQIVVVGAPSGGGDGDGRVYVYVRPAGSPAGAGASGAKRLQRGFGAPVATLRAASNRGKAHAKGIGNKFGDSVAISGDGQLIAVGAPTGGGANTGQVVVFEMPPGGWGDLEGLPPIAVVDPPADPGVVASGFGSHVEFTPDGMLVVGAPGAIVSAVDAAGAAFLFDTNFDPLGTPITATSPEAGAEFGTAIDVSGGLLAVGAPGENNSTGAAYFFEMDAGVIGPANQQTPAGGSFGDKWGSTIVIGDGAVVVGAPNDDTAAGADSGSATVFVQDGGNNVRLAGQLVPDPGMGTQGAGMSIATNGDVVVLGAPFSDVGGQTDRGRAIVFDLDAAVLGSVRPAGYYENAIGEAGDQFGSAVGMSRVFLLLGAPLSDEGPDVNEGRVDPFMLDRIFRGGFDR